MKLLAKIAFLVFFLSIIYTCKKEEEKEKNPSTDYIIYENSQGEVGAGGGKITLNDQSSPLNGVSVDIPKGALESPVSISINSVQKGYSFENDTTNLFVSLEPSGTQFTVPVQIGIPYKSNENPDSLQVYYYDETDFTWKPVIKGAIDRDKKIIFAQTNHFTVFTTEISNVTFDMELFKNGNSISAKVWLITPLSSFVVYDAYRVRGDNIREIIEGNTAVYIGYILELKEKNDWWTDKVIGTKKIIIGRVSATDESNQVLWYISAVPAPLPDEREKNMSGRPVLYQFPNVTLNNSKKYYLEVKMYFLERNDWDYLIDHAYVKQGYFVSSFEDAKTPLEMGLPPDADGDGITDEYDPINGNSPIQPSLLSPVDNSPELNNYVTLMWDSSDPDGDPLTYDVFVGLDNPPSTTVATNLSTKSFVCQNLTRGKTYYWKIVAKDNNGNSTSSSVWKFSLVSAPVANFIVNQTTITPGGSVTFTDQSTNTPTSWSWNFGDGANSTSQNPSHAYSTPGTYTVTLTVTNSYGSNTETKTNYVTVTTANSAPVANFIANQTTITPGGSVTFTDQSTNSPTIWSWNLEMEQIQQVRIHYIHFQLLEVIL
jgi:PKD repeat protein